VGGILLTSLIAFPNNANAECVSYIQSQTISAAYNGDEVPTVNTMQTCNGDDTSYQIPIATTITFDGIEYDSVYATTNSVITFGRADNTYWDYPTTPSISLYSMDWYAGIGAATEGLVINYSEGGFQINLQVIPYGQWSAQASDINILVAITNTGGISVAYSYQGPEYSNLRTGVRLTDGSIVSLEEWGATKVAPGSNIELSSEPISDPNSEEPLTPEQQQQQVAESLNLASDISNINALILSAANATDSQVVEPEQEPETVPVEETIPDVVVEPEIITPEDPRFPENIDEQTPQEEASQTPETETTPESGENQDAEPSVKPELQPEDISLSPVVEQGSNPSLTEDIKSYINSSTMGISEDEAKKLVALAANNTQLATAIQEFSERSEQNTNTTLPYTLADATTEVQAETFLADPIGAIFNVNPAELLSNFSELGSDMTDDQREKAQEVIVPVIIASQVIGGMMRRNK
jgi:hypothetical protein